MTDKICPECQSTNPASESLCDQCGCPLDEGLTTGDTSAVKEQTCDSCGAEVALDANFCDGCGRDMTAGDSHPGSPAGLGPESTEEATALAATADPAVATVTQEPSAAEESPAQTGAMQTDAGQAASEKTIANSTPEAAAEPLADGSATASPLWKLTAVEGYRVGKEYVLYRDEMLLGRMDPDDDIFPDLDMEDQDDGYVSRRHAKLLVAPDEVSIVDLGGENGTLIDNRPIPPNKPMQVRLGQVIKVGKVGLMLQYHRGSAH